MDAIKPMLARLARDLPEGDYVYEPKWDGFRCLAFVESGTVELVSRNGRPLARYFPEITSALAALERDAVIDGELLVVTTGGADFEALLQRLHPAASRVRRLAAETPAVFVTFDLVALDERDLRNEPFARRRDELIDLIGHRPPLYVTPATADRALARVWLDGAGGGVDGVVAKDTGGRYAPGKRTMIKVKLEKVADCVVGGFRWHGRERAVGSLLLGLYDGDGVLRHVGLTASFSEKRRRSLLDDVEPFVADMDGHPWAHGFPHSEGPVGRLPGAASRWGYGGEPTWVPLDPKLVCEVAYDHLQGDRFRHPPQFRRWRPDRDAATCTYEQFEAHEVDVRALLEGAA